MPSWEEWRLSKYKPEHCQAAYKVLASGKSKAHVCVALHCSKNAMLDWMREFPDFKEAVEAGLNHGESVFRDKVEDHAWQPSGKVNNGLIKLMASNVYGIKEDPTTVVNVSQNNNKPVTDDTLKERGVPVPKIEAEDVD